MAIVPSEASSYTKALCKILDNINIGTGNKDKWKMEIQYRKMAQHVTQNRCNLRCTREITKIKENIYNKLISSGSTVNTW